MIICEIIVHLLVIVQNKKFKNPIFYLYINVAKIARVATEMMKRVVIAVPNINLERSWAWKVIPWHYSYFGQ